jgi:hypothetical protein
MPFRANAEGSELSPIGSDLTLVRLNSDPRRRRARAAGKFPSARSPSQDAHVLVDSSARVPRSFRDSCSAWALQENSDRDSSETTIVSRGGNVEISHSPEISKRRWESF